MSQQLTVYHGTSAEHASAILAAGLEARTCVTPDLDLAWYYAEESAEETDTDPVVLALEVEQDELELDDAALSEPVGWGGRSGSQIEAELEQMGAERWTLTVSLSQVASARVKDAVDGSRIRRED